MDVSSKGWARPNRGRRKRARATRRKRLKLGRAVAGRQIRSRPSDDVSADAAAAHGSPVSQRRAANLRRWRAPTAILMVMSTTVTVAIITSLSTLAGVGVSGCIAFFIGRTQAKTQIKLADSDKTEQRFKERQQTRRDSYVQFLNQVSKVEQTLNVTWQSSAPSTAGKTLTMLNVELNALTPHVNLIDLEGPVGVSSVCTELQIRLGLEMTALTVVMNFSRSKKGAIAFNNQEIFKNSFLKRLEVKTGEVTKKMQEALSAGAQNQERVPQKVRVRSPG